MMRHATFCLVVGVFAALMAPDFSKAADAVGAIPSDALGFLRIDGVRAMDGKVGRVMKALDLPGPGLLERLKAVPGLSESLDLKAPFALALVEGAGEGAAPVPIAILPVKDFAGLAKAFGSKASEGAAEIQLPGREVLAREQGGLAFLVEAKDAGTLQRVLKSEAGIVEKLGEDLTWVESRDVSLVMTDRGIALMCAKVLEGITIAQEQIGKAEEDPFGAAEILNVYKTIFAGVDDEVELVAMGLDLPKGGDSVLRVRKRFVPGSRLAECLKLEGTTPDLLAGLPGEPFVFAGGMVFNRALSDLMMEFSIDAMKAAPKLYGINEEQAARMLEMAGPMMGRLRGMSMIFAVGGPEDSLYSRMVVVMTVAKDAQAFMEEYEEYIRQFGSLVEGSKGLFSMKMETRPMELAGRKGIEVSMDFPLDRVKGDPKATAVLEKMLGPEEKLKAFILPVDATRVAVGYTREALLLKTIEVLEGKGEQLSESRAVESVRNLEPGNFGMGYLSPRGLIAFVASMASAMAPEDAEPVTIPEFPETPPVACSVNASGATVDAQMVVPREVLKAMVDYQAQLRKMAAEKSE